MVEEGGTQYGTGVGLRSPGSNIRTGYTNMKFIDILGLGSMTSNMGIQGYSIIQKKIKGGNQKKRKEKEKDTTMQMITEEKERAMLQATEKGRGKDTIASIV